MYGAGPPNSAMGRDGDWYIDTNTHNMYGPKSSGAWPVTYTSLIGPQGPAGVNGNTILYGSGAPANTLGVDGNFYIDTSAHMLYGPKAGGVWPAGTSLIGPQGPQGIPGTPGANGQRGSLWYEGAGAPGTISGVLANDNYLNTTNGDVYNYSGSSWGSPVGNIRGPIGLTGPAGSTTVTISSTAPASPVDNQIWWNSTNGQFYVRYNDGTSTQWVAATPLIDTTALVQKAGDTMTGPLVLPADPTSALQAATKQYVDTKANTDYMIVESHAANAVTYAIKTLAGADPSSTTPINIQFRNGNNGFVTRAITGPLSITVPAGATLGQVSNNYAFRIWLAFIDDAGTVRLGVYTSSLVSGGTYATLSHTEDNFYTGTAISSSATAAYTMYTAVAVTTNRNFKWAGYFNYESGLAAVGNWAVSPDKIEVRQRGTPLPGARLNHYYNSTQVTSSVSTTTATLIGTALAWTMASGANLIKYRVEGYIYLRAAVANEQGTVKLTRNGAAGIINSSGPNLYQAATTDAISSFAAEVYDKPGNMTSNTYQPLATNFNTGSGLVQYSIWSNILEEIMA